MNEWMASSQLMITKPGGITISEALTRQIPMIFLDPAPGQELENAVYFEEKAMVVLPIHLKLLLSKSLL